MKKLILRVNIFLSSIIIIFLFIVIFGNDRFLNSLLINDVEENSFAYDVLFVDYDKVVYTNDYVMNDNYSTNTIPTVTKTVNSSNKWVWPTDKGYVITTYYSSGHKAIDIAGTGYGSNIYAANKGVVTSVMGGCVPGNTSCNGRGGNYIVINHNNGYYTVYMHLKSFNVKVGDSVYAGQVIGKMGNTGNVIPVPDSSNPFGGTHLHFSLYKGEPYNGGYEVNPFNMY